MSLSDAESRRGVIFMGPTPDRETTLDRLGEAAQREIWNRRTEEEYLERVKARATERVRALLLQTRQRQEEMLAEAREQADSLKAEAEALRVDAARIQAEVRAIRDEAEALRASAHEEGVAAGRAEIMDQVAEDSRAQAETIAVVLLSIHEQCASIFEAWRADLASLVREAVQKATGWVADQERTAMLQSLLDQSMRALLDRRRFTVRVNPVDTALLTDMLASAHRANAQITQWEVTSDPTLEPGSLVVESDSALVDNSTGARRSLVAEILQQLTVPSGPADDKAAEAVGQALKERMALHGVFLDESPAETQAADPTEVPPFSPALSSEEAILLRGVPDPQSEIRPVESDGQPSPLAIEEENNTQTESRPEAVLMPEDESSQSNAIHETEQTNVGEAEGVNKTAEAVPLPDSPISTPQISDPVPEAKTEAEAEAETEAQNLVREFLEDSDEAGNDLPPDVADELLADLGIGDSKHGL